MFQSKALKDFGNEHKRSSKLYLWWIESWIGNLYYDLSWKFFGSPLHQVKKLYGWWKNVFRYDYDFDGHSLFAIIEYKLQRLEKVLVKGMAVQETKDMKALKIAIKLTGRLKDDKYDDSFHRRHDKKWGKMKSWLTPAGKNLSTWNHSRPNANTPKKKKQEVEDFRSYMQAIDNQKKREEKWLYGILQNHLRSWWD